MPHLEIENRTHEITNDAAWTTECVELCSGDLIVDGTPFGTYVAARYTQSPRPPQFIVNAIHEDGQVKLSIPFECHSGANQSVVQIPETASPWQTDGILIGPIPSLPEMADYTRAQQILQVARELVAVERIFASAMQ
jgi:hypothetical protein